MNLFEQVKATPQLIENFIHENIIRHSRNMTKHDYLAKMANAIIDNDTGN